MSSPTQVAGSAQHAAADTANTAKDAAADTASVVSDAAGQTASAAKDAAADTAAAAKEQVSQVQDAATGAASDVAGTVKEQASAVAGEAATQARDLFEQTKAQVSEQAATAQSQLGKSLAALATELTQMGSGNGTGDGPAADLARTLGERGQSVAAYLAAKQPGDLVTDLRSYAARRPSSFLLGALAAGLVTGRVVRGATAAAKDDEADTSPAAPASSASGLPPFPLGSVTPATALGYGSGVGSGVGAGDVPLYIPTTS